MNEIKEVCACDCESCMEGNCEGCTCQSCDCDGCQCGK